ncbi:hypothetical protein WMF04_16155 [Sorangium sp. So ce260]|uniref:hypothetical protein n=1 Tax=Sorangium sp. So ce260 TaxID=3133291 RepID=UPI003F6197B8
MIRGRRIGLAALVALACGGCSSPDEIVLAVSTDLALPKDFEILQIQVFEGTKAKFNHYSRRLGESEAEARLPATIGFFSSDGGGESIRFTVSARLDDDLGPVRIVREAVTTIPKNRVALLTLPLNFLCDGSGKSAGTDVEKTLCGDGQTCVAGACVSNEIDSSALPDYSPGDVYGGGNGEGNGDCFDVTACFQGATPADVDTAGCTIAGDGGPPRNVALETAAGDGVCDGTGDDRRCLVALDAGSDDGFRVEGDGRILLPPAVCDQMAQDKIAAVVTAPTTDCAQKTAGLPTCGPWSASGSEEP